MLKTPFPISVGTNKQSEKLALRLCLLYITRLLCMFYEHAYIHVYSSNVAGVQSRFPTSTKTNSNKNVSCEFSKCSSLNMSKTPFLISVATNKQSEKLTLRLCLLCISILGTYTNASIFL